MHFFQENEKQLAHWEFRHKLLKRMRTGYCLARKYLFHFICKNFYFFHFCILHFPLRFKRIFIIRIYENFRQIFFLLFKIRILKCYNNLNIIIFK